MKFWKLEAAGNDFVLLNQKPSDKADEIFFEVSSLCATHRGIGADGLVYCWQNGSDWNWRFFNSDGSETSLCGNAARALGLWLFQNHFSNSSEWNWSGKLGKFTARKNKRDEIEVTWPLSELKQQKISEDLMRVLVNFNERGLAGVFHFEVGVPHLVLLNFDQWNMEDRQIYGAMLRSHPSLGPEGANVTWMNLKTLEVVTFERGVEAETLACGSGALASFLALNAHKQENGGEVLASAQLRFPGGDLGVLNDGGKLWLSGASRIVFEGEFLK